MNHLEGMGVRVRVREMELLGKRLDRMHCARVELCVCVSCRYPCAHATMGVAVCISADPSARTQVAAWRRVCIYALVCVSLRGDTSTWW